MGVSYLPAAPEHVALYLVDIGLQAATAAPIEAASCAIKWAHRKACLAIPTEHALVSQTVKASQRLLARPAAKKKVLTLAVLERLCEKFGGESAPLKYVQMLCLLSLGFKGFLRWDDMARLTVANVEFFECSMTVFIASRKNDQFREGHLVPIAATPESPACAVTWMRRFLQESGRRGLQSKAVLFGKISFGRGKWFVRGEMTYSRALECFREMLQEVNESPQEYGLHSLRSGGVSAALQVPGESVRLVQRHGGWRHIESMQGYVKEGDAALLSVTSGLK